MNETIDVVVAKYKEDVGWTRSIKHNVIIYDKSENGPIAGAIPLPNIGRETHTYLHHIVNNYDKLADYTIFLQGNPHDHADLIPNNTNDKCAEFINTLSTPLTFQPFLVKEDMWDFYPEVKWDGVVKIINSHKIFKDIVDYEILFARGAQYIVPKKNILARSLTFYQKLYELSKTNIVHDTDPDRMCPWCFERLWMRIFGEEWELNSEFLKEE